jgi:hypothetical protein
LTVRKKWRYGSPVGVHVDRDADGTESRTEFVDGVPRELADDARKRARVLRAATNPRKDYYQRADAIGGIVDYEWRSAYVVHLWRAGHLDLPAQRRLWGFIAPGLLSGADLVTFLRAAGFQVAEQDACVVPGWSGCLDEIVMEVYGRDPAPLDEAWRSLPDWARDGRGRRRRRLHHAVRPGILRREPRRRRTDVRLRRMDLVAVRVTVSR